MPLKWSRAKLANPNARLHRGIHRWWFESRAFFMRCSFHLGRCTVLAATDVEGMSKLIVTFPANSGFEIELRWIGNLPFQWDQTAVLPPKKECTERSLSVWSKVKSLNVLVSAVSLTINQKMYKNVYCIAFCENGSNKVYSSVIVNVWKHAFLDL